METPTASEILDKQRLHTFYHPYGDVTKPEIHDRDCNFCYYEDLVIAAMEEYASLKTKSLQSELDALRKKEQPI